MKKIVKLTTSAVPFALVITLNVFAGIADYNLAELGLVALIIGVFLSLNLIISSILKRTDYFIYGISVVALLGIFSMFVIPSIGQIYIHNAIFGLYLGLFIVAFFPPLVKIKPFTISISESDYPKVVTRGQQFWRINIIINYIWAALFAFQMFLSVITYSNNYVIQLVLTQVISNVILVGVGVPVVKFLPAYFIQKIPAKPLHFETAKELFEAMPIGLNKELSKNVNVILQFYLTGEETEGYLIIKDSKCSFTNGVHPNPTTIIKADSKLWVSISNNETSGSKAYLNKEYIVEGDMAILDNLNDLFAPPGTVKKQKGKPKVKKIDFNYKTFEPGMLKKIVVFDGGPRTTKFSKTSLMVNHFIEGAKEAGADVEVFKLKDLDIHDCSGCFNCWTKTPGECIYKDDMTMLRKKYREANLVVFASPLYIFSVTGILKRFMDRLLPVLEPYMLIDEHGYTLHPDRYPELGKQGFVVFSASGFPDLENNFNGLREMFKMWSTHGENMHMVGEFYLTAAETIVHPIYANRKNMVQEVCKKAGEQIVKEGKIDNELMQSVTDPGFTSEKFQDESNNFWKSLENKTSYLKGSPKIS